MQLRLDSEIAAYIFYVFIVHIITILDLMILNLFILDILENKYIFQYCEESVKGKLMFSFYYFYNLHLFEIDKFLFLFHITVCSVL